MLSKGLDMIRRESRYKSALTYQVLSEVENVEIFVQDQSFRSQTTIVAGVDNSINWVNQLKDQGLIIGQGYGLHKKNQIRIANFPTHSKEQFERLVDELVKLN